MTTAILFPGQGSQTAGMGRALYASEPAARAIFDQADAQLGYALTEICFAEEEEETLRDTAVQQPALFTVGMARWAVLEKYLATSPAFMAGHSMGEITALTAAGALSFAAGLELVRQRGLLMQKAGERNPGGMAAILGLDWETVSMMVAHIEGVVAANDNCAGQVVIAGSASGLEKAEAAARVAGARKVSRLPVSIASHSPLMEVISHEFSEILSHIPVNTPRIPVIGNLTAESLPAPRRIRAELARQLTSPVRWRESMLHLRERGVDRFVEVGPGQVLTQLMKRIDKSATRLRFEDIYETASE